MPNPTPNPLIPAGAVRAIDRFRDRLLTDTCTISRPKPGRGASGAPKSGEPEDIATDEPCRVLRRDISGKLSTVAGKLTSDADYRVEFRRTLPEEQRPQATDVITTGSGARLHVTDDGSTVTHGFGLLVDVKGLD